MKTILVFGDSNVWGYFPEVERLPFEQRLCGLLNARLGNNYRIIEDGLPGRMARMEDPLSPNHCGYPHLETALEVNAPVDLLVLHLGTNEARDMLNMNGYCIAASLERLVNLAKNHPAGYNAQRILIVAPHPLAPDVGNRAFDYLFSERSHRSTLDFGKAFEDLAKRTGCDFLDCAPLEFELSPTDGIHYSANDVQKLANAISDYILRENI